MDTDYFDNTANIIFLAKIFQETSKNVAKLFSLYNLPKIHFASGQIITGRELCATAAQNPA
ncbi:MAG: hypothetical protein M3384_03195 [Acidobacteriota bacterium]|nr:hypothetical protein [Acidobacteriota bacterium]